MNAEQYSKDVKVALDLARVSGESEEKIIENALNLFLGTTHPELVKIAKGWGDLGKKIQAVYTDDEGGDFRLGEIGELAASAYGWLG